MYIEWGLVIGIWNRNWDRDAILLWCISDSGIVGWQSNGFLNKCGSTEAAEKAKSDKAIKNVSLAMG